jgi:hypothetical protein
MGYIFILIGFIVILLIYFKYIKPKNNEYFATSAPLFNYKLDIQLNNLNTTKKYILESDTETTPFNAPNYILTPDIGNDFGVTTGPKSINFTDNKNKVFTFTQTKIDINNRKIYGTLAPTPNKAAYPALIADPITNIIALTGTGNDNGTTTLPVIFNFILTVQLKNLNITQTYLLGY